MIFKRWFGFLAKGSQKVSNFDIFSKTGPGLSQTIRIASKKRYEDLQFWSLVKTRFQYIYKGLNGRNLSHMANGFARAGMKDKSIWNSIKLRALEISESLDCQDIALLWNAMCKVETLDEEVFKCLCENIKRKVENIGPRYASMIIHSMGRSKMVDKELANSLFNVARSNIQELSMISISNLINGQYHMNYYDPKLMIGLIEVIKRNLETNKKIELKTVVSIYQGYSNTNIYDKALYKAMFDYMVENIGSMKMMEMAIVANCMNRSRLHNEELISKMNKKIIKKPKGYYLEEVGGYLSGLLNAKYVPKMEKILELVGIKKFKGVLNTDNSVKFLQVYSKFGIENVGLLELLVEQVNKGLENMSQRELVNVIGCYKCLKAEYLRKYVERYLELEKLNGTNSSKDLSRVLYALKEVREEEFESYKEKIMKKLNYMDEGQFEEINVVNVLCALEDIKESEEKNNLVNKLVDSTRRRFNKFSNQMLTSVARSALKLNRVEELYFEFCKNWKRFEGHRNEKDNIKALEFLNGFNYFRNFKEGELRMISQSYRVFLNNLEEKDEKEEGGLSEEEGGNKSEKVEVDESEEKVIREAKNILKMVELKFEWETGRS